MPRIMELPAEWYSVASGRFFLQAQTLSWASPWTGRRGVSGITQFWRAEMTFAVQDHENWMEMEGFFAEVGGDEGIIRVRDFARDRPLRDIDLAATQSEFSDGSRFTDGSAFSNGYLPSLVHVAESASRGETDLLIAGLPASITGCFRRGDQFEIRRNGAYDETPSLHQVVRKANSNADGETRLDFRPSLRKAVAAGDQVVVRHAMGNFRLVDNEQGAIERTPPLLGNLGISLIEALV